MLPFKKILCPTDFSEPSMEAVRAANELTLHFAAKLYLAHVIRGTPGVGLGRFGEGLDAFDIVGYEKALARDARRRLKDLIGNIVSNEARVGVVVTLGDPAKGILEIAEKEKVDLIVIATHGRTGWPHLVTGSVAEKVVRHASCPVLTIRMPRKQTTG